MHENISLTHLLFQIAQSVKIKDIPSSVIYFRMHLVPTLPDIDNQHMFTNTLLCI